MDTAINLDNIMDRLNDFAGALGAEFVSIAAEAQGPAEMMRYTLMKLLPSPSREQIM